MLEGKCALLTGSTGGLGYAIANRLAAQGANIVLNGLCDAGEGADAAARLREAHGVDATFDPADLRAVPAIGSMMAAAAERFGGVDILVNNAVVRSFGPIEAVRPEQWDESIAVNLSAAFHCVRLALPGMKARRWGRIVNLSSVYGWRGAEDRVDYVTTKTALVGMTRAVALETAADGITCNALSPGTLPSPAILGKLEAMAEAEGAPLEDVTRDYIAARHPTGRFIALENVAALVAFLCGPAGADITGALLPVDGGWTAS